MTLPDGLWQAFRELPPSPETTSIHALAAHGHSDLVEGDPLLVAQHRLHIDRVLDCARGFQRAAAGPRSRSGRRTIGRYLDVLIAGREQILYYETAGDGPPLICLHTAGSDSRQYEFVLEDEQITDQWTVFAFDAPGHGRSSPPADWMERPHELRIHDYIETLFAFASGIGADRPALLGCSMGGSMALYAAACRGDELRGVCSVGGSGGNPSRRNIWASHGQVDHSRFVQSWVGGLFAPDSPPELRAEVLWHYAQGGPGVYYGDTNVGANELAEAWSSVDGPVRCPAHILSGEYDYSHMPSDSRGLANRIGATFEQMTGLGHFAIFEDPDRFLPYLRRVLREFATPAI